jgi:hypothetical protein
MTTRLCSGWSWQMIHYGKSLCLLYWFFSSGCLANLRFASCLIQFDLVRLAWGCALSVSKPLPQGDNATRPYLSRDPANFLQKYIWYLSSLMALIMTNGHDRIVYSRLQNRLPLLPLPKKSVSTDHLPWFGEKYGSTGNSCALSQVHSYKERGDKRISSEATRISLAH